MEVDIQQLKRRIERELRELEQRKSALREQMKHIESVESMARGTLIPGELGDQVVEPNALELVEVVDRSETRSWFRR
jgi:hypothetical protein